MYTHFKYIATNIDEDIIYINNKIQEYNKPLFYYKQESKNTRVNVIYIFLNINSFPLRFYNCPTFYQFPKK